MSRFFSLIFILFFSCSTKEYPIIIIDEIPKNQMEFQKTQKVVGIAALGLGGGTVGVNAALKIDNK